MVFHENKGVPNEVKNMTRERVKIEGMGCSHCISAVRGALEKLDVDIHTVEIGSAEIGYGSSVNRKQIDDAISEAGYKTVGREVIAQAE